MSNVVKTKTFYNQFIGVVNLTADEQFERWQKDNDGVIEVISVSLTTNGGGFIVAYRLITVTENKET